MTSALEALFAKVEELDRAATKGPWRVSMSGYSVKSKEYVIPGVSRIVFSNPRGVWAKERDIKAFLDNAEFAVEARTLLPAMAKALKVAVAAYGEYHTRHDYYRDRCNGCDQAWPCAPVRALLEIESLLAEALK